jgi:hypothetical protein
VHSSDDEGSSDSESDSSDDDLGAHGDTNAEKNQRYHGKDSRRSAIMSSIKGETVRRQIVGRKSSYASRWMAVLGVYLLDVLKKSPFEHPASRLFTFDLSTVKDVLVASTRHSIHDCLKHPKSYYRATDAGESTKDATIGIDASDEDACIAFSLYDQDGSCSNLVDWYLSFESIVSGEPVDQEQARMERIGRFSQSLQDLMYIGMITGSRKRAGDHAQRNVFQPDL